MRTALFAAGILCTLSLSAVAGEPDGAQQPLARMCIRTLDIDHTRTPNNRTILFYMKDGKVWQTTLTTYCPEITFDGFSYVATPPDDICGNVQLIRSIRSGSICEMGPLVPVNAPPGS